MNRYKTILLEVSRMFISFVFISSSVMKANDPVGLSLKIKEYLSFAPNYLYSLIEYLSPTLSLILILLEFSIGLGLLLSIRSRKLAIATTFLMSFMTLITLIVYLTGYVKDCGCFGDAIHLSNGETLLKNIFLMPFVIFIHINRHHLKPIWKNSIIMGLNKVLAILGFLIFLGLNYLKLPFVDFREYKIGTNLKEQMEIQDKRNADLLLSDTRYVYRKGNIEKSFSSDSLPSGDDWVFVKVKEPDYAMSLKYDFHPIDVASKEDIADKILSDNRPSLLIITKSLDNIDNRSDLVITSIANKMYEKGYPQYLIYSGLYSENNNFANIYSNRLGCVANMDQTTISTMVRTTPAIIVIQNGVIINKITKLDFPNLNNIAKFVDRLDGLKPVDNKNNFRIYILIASIIIGLAGNVKRIFNLILIKNNLDNEKKHCSRKLENEQDTE